MQRTRLLLLILFALVGAANAAGLGLSAPQIEEISQLATDTLLRERLPGLSVAVAKHGQIWSAGIGKADLEQDVPVRGRLAPAAPVVPGGL
jgi:CubicO group peptidase (beta-lactamase class C family)